MNPKLGLVALALGKSFVLLSFGYLLSRYVLKWIFDQIAKTPEMVVAMSIAWCVIMVGIASWMGLSMEMDALIAGVSISSFPYGVHIIAKVLPLRDFFLPLFFLSIGIKIPAPDTAILLGALIMVVFVIDFNLEVLKELNIRGVKGMFGDIGSMDTLDHAHIQNADLIILTIPDMLLKGTSNETIVRTCRPLAPQAVIMATADSTDQIARLKRAGANEVLLPYSMIGDALAGFVEKLTKPEESSRSPEN